jgi:signal transduction histidine kinase
MSSPRDPTQSILVVDDTPANIDVLRDLLKDEYRILAAKSGLAALDLLGRSPEPPSLVLLDIMMPELDGFGTLERLRCLPGCDRLPVIFISALGEVDSKTRGFALGAVDYVTKPFEPEEVLARVRTHLALADARALLERQNRELEEAARLREDVERITRHDLKSPLNAIIATAQFELANEGLDPNLKESLEVIATSGLDMLQMINLSLDLFKMERGLYRLKAEPVGLRGLAERIARETGPMRVAGRLEMQLATEGNPADSAWTVPGEPLLCYSLLGNLMRNAMEAAPAGGVISVRLIAGPDGATSVAIRNPGEVPTAVRGRLFAKFATAGKSGGTGLGLYSARLIAGTLGAQLDADLSEPGHTTFRIVFPAA